MWGLASAPHCYVVQIQLEEETGVRLNLSKQKTAVNKLSRWKSTKIVMRKRLVSFGSGLFRALVLSDLI